MNKNHKTQKPGRSPSDAQIEKLLRKVAVEEGACIPQTPDELEALDTLLATKPQPTPPEFSEVLRMIREKQEHQPENNALTDLVGHLDDEVTSGLAMAARNGSKISDEVRRQMDSDREIAENLKRRKK